MVLLIINSIILFLITTAVYAWDKDNPESVKEYVGYVAAKEGLNVSSVLKIARCESNFNKDALAHTPKEYSVGIFQINLKAHPYITEAQARNPFFNISWAIDRMKEGLWHWWTCKGTS